LGTDDAFLTEYFIVPLCFILKQELDAAKYQRAMPKITYTPSIDALDTSCFHGIKHKLLNIRNPFFKAYFVIKEKKTENIINKKIELVHVGRIARDSI